MWLGPNQQLASIDTCNWGCTLLFQLQVHLDRRQNHTTQCRVTGDATTRLSHGSCAEQLARITERDGVADNALDLIRKVLSSNLG
jgi:hypothetical protein